MGTIYRARQIELDRPVAIKFLATGSLGVGDSFQRFVDEARVCSKMNHANIVQLYEFDVDVAQPYLVFEFIEGKNLKNLMDERKVLTVKSVLEMMARVCDALDYAHSLGIIHRDLKPENILIDSSRQPKIADFGLAKLGGVTSVQTRTGVVLGTPLYMSPEQAREEKLGPKTDIYSIGVLLYEMLTGTPPIDGHNDMDILLKHLKFFPPPITSFEPELSSRLDRLVRSCLAKKPEKRPETAGLLAKKLRRLARPSRSWDPESVSVTLGVREGVLRSSTYSDGAEGKTKLSATDGLTGASLKSSAACSQVSALSVLSMAGGALKRRYSMMAPFLILLLAALLIIGVFFVGKPDETPAVSRFSIDARGARTLLVSWTASWRDEKPVFLLRKKGSTLSVPYKLQSLEIHCLRGQGQGAPQYRHSVLVRNLKPKTAYTIALKLSSSAHSLTRDVSTVQASSLTYTRGLSLGEDRTLSLRFDSKTPVFISSGVRPLRSEPSLEYNTKLAFTQTWILTYALDAFTDNDELDLTMTTVDGAEKSLHIVPSSLVIRSLEEVYKSFISEHQSGSFYSIWSDGTSSRVNSDFQDAASRYVKFLKAEKEKKNEDLERFWRLVRSRLSKKSRWYPKLSRLLPGLPVFLSTGLGGENGRYAVARALIPLELVHNAAQWFFRRYIPSPWPSVLLNRNRPYPISYGRSQLGRPDFERVFDCHSLVPIPFWMLYDPQHPKFSSFVKQKFLRSRLVGRSLSLDLSDVDLSSYRYGEIEIVNRSAYVALLIVVDINGGKFQAVFRNRVQTWLAIEDWARQKHVYTRLGLILLSGEHERIGMDPTTVARAFKEIEEVLPPRKLTRPMYHRIPLSCLKRAVNHVKMYTLIGPSEDLEGTVCESLTLRLKQ